MTSYRKEIINCNTYNQAFNQFSSRYESGYALLCIKVRNALSMVLNTYSDNYLLLKEHCLQILGISRTIQENKFLKSD